MGGGGRKSQEHKTAILERREKWDKNLQTGRKLLQLLVGDKELTQHRTEETIAWQNHLNERQKDCQSSGT